MAIEAAGPVFTGGFETVTIGSGGDRYSILFLPDIHNDDLRIAGKPEVYYWMPGIVRMARKGDTGDYKFHLIHFVGVQSSDTHVGVDGRREVAGGVFSLTTTAAFPADIMQKAQDELLNRFRGKDIKYWGWRSATAPMFRPMPIVANVTTISNLSPQSDGSLPNLAAASGTATPGTGSGTPAPAGGGPPAVVGGGPRSIGPEALERMPRTVPDGPAFRAPANIDPWFWKMQGQGPGSINPTGENAYSALIGSLPAAILWQGFHGSYSPIVVSQAMKLKVWSQTLRIKIRGNWDRIFQHFSAAASGHYWWFSADIKAEFNKLMINGGITVELEIDGTLPSADKLREEANKRIDLITQKFMEQANTRIFEPAPPNVEPAQANSGGWFWGGAVALKYRRDETHLNLTYDETVHEQYLQDHVISSSLEGFYNEIKKDATAEKKYFTTLYLDDWDRKVTRIVKPVVNWSDPSRKWVGEPVAFLSVQIGYPSTAGDIQWVPHIFQNTDTGDLTRWEPAFTKKTYTDVVKPPRGWQPDMTVIKRAVHFLEPPSETDSPFMRVFVEQNVVELDGKDGTLSNNNTIEVRADSAGMLEVGPIALSVDLENSKQVVEIEVQADGKTAAGKDRPVVRFQFKYEDQNELRYWSIFTGQLDYVPSFKYRVHVVVKGSLFSKGMEWWGPWQQVSGNGPLMASVPTPDDTGVTRRSLLPDEISSASPVPVSAGTPPPAPAPTPEPSPVAAPPVPVGAGGGGPGQPPPTTRTDSGNGSAHGYELLSSRDLPPVPPSQPASEPEPVPVGSRSETNGSRTRAEDLVLAQGWRET